jgi:hypothetical protein
MRPLLLFGAMMLAACLTTLAEEPPTTEQLHKQIEIIQDEIASLRSKLAARDGPLYDKYVEAKKKEYDYQSSLMQSNLDAFTRQGPQTYTIMALVVLVVIGGLLFSAYQLWKSVQLAGVQTTSELEVSAKNVRVTSSIVGVIVLIISIAFLYIYAREVYQLHAITSYAPEIRQSTR